MGNRAVVVFEKDEPAAYLHWAGDPEKVTAFLGAMIDRGWTRLDYGQARFCAIACEYLDSEGTDEGLSVGVLSAEPSYDHGDNGTYYVSKTDRGWNVDQMVGGAVYGHEVTKSGVIFSPMYINAQGADKREMLQIHERIRGRLKDLRDRRQGYASLSTRLYGKDSGVL